MAIIMNTQMQDGCAKPMSMASVGDVHAGTRPFDWDQHAGAAMSGYALFAAGAGTFHPLHRQYPARSTAARAARTAV
jgi:hypothetical protein